MGKRRRTLLMNLPKNATGDALQRYIDHGSNLTKPMKMDFFVWVPTQEAGAKVAERAEALGFMTRLEQNTELPEWTCYCTKTIVPSYATVVEMEEQLDAIGRECGGHAGGFGSFGNSEA
jgi:hypothetical protein